MTHWLQIGGMRIREAYERKQWENLSKYLEQHQGSNATVYIKNTGDIYARIIKLECEQSYNDIEIDCNSCFDGSIRYLNSRPNNIEISKLQLDYYMSKGVN
jgi:hypothetical protein